MRKLHRFIKDLSAFSDDYYFGNNNQDIDLFQRQFLIGLYECSSRKTKGMRTQHDTNQSLLRHFLPHRCSCCEHQGEDLSDNLK